MKVDQFTEFPCASGILLNEDASYGVFQVSQAHRKLNKYLTNLWLLDTKTEKIRPLTSSDSDGNYRFLDRSTILFTSGRPKKEADKEINASSEKKEEKKKEERTSDFYTISVEGGEATFAYSLPYSVADFEPLSRDQLLFLGNPFPKKEEWVEIEELPFWSNGQDFTVGCFGRLYVFDKPSEKVKQVTEDCLNVFSYVLSKDKKKVLFLARDRRPAVAPVSAELFLLNLEDGSVKQISHDKMVLSAAVFNREETKAIVLGSEAKKHGLNEDDLIYLYDLESGEKSLLSKEDFDHSFWHAVGSDVRGENGSDLKLCEEGLYFIESLRYQAGISCIDKEGNYWCLLSDHESVESFDRLPEKEAALYYFAMDEGKLAELYVQDAQGRRCLSHFSDCLKDIPLAPIEHFTFSSNGDELDGFVLKPLNYEKGKSYPAILSIHGGPKTAFGKLLHHEMQYLASLGYFVFFTNPHGSDGYGVEFSDIYGRYGTIDYEDLMNFTDLVLEKYEDIDKNRLGVMGGSYGGFMTNWIIGHTDRFKAANSQRSISNWFSFYGVSDIGYTFAPDQTGGDLFHHPEKAWEASPLKYAEHAKTPTLFIHSDHDLRCPLEQGMQMYTALTMQGVETKLVVFKKETHELSRSGRPQSRIKRLEEIAAWFAHYLQAN